jgi:PAS domain S-box-containing protein
MNKLTYQELENQIVELKKQNEILRLQFSNQKEKVNYHINILNNIGDPVFVKDDQSRLIIVNDAFSAVFGLKKEEIIGKTLAEHVPPDERESFLKIDMQVIEDGVENINEESLTVNGSEKRTVSTRKTRFLDSNGTKYLVGVIHDITERKEAEDSLKENEKQLKDLNATKDKLFSIIAHDLRSPFNNIIELSELLDKNTINFEESKKYSRILNSSAKNTLNLLTNLLNWAQSQTGQLTFKPEKILLSDVILEIISLNKIQTETKNISLVYFSSDKMEVYADKNMLKTILRNLISNAIKFTNVGGSIKVFSILKQDHVVITVADDGIGMNIEKSKGLFDVNSKTTTIGTENGEGSGLGLILCKEFVQKNEGKIWVESEEGKGSSFKFSLPLNISE